MTDHRLVTGQNNEHASCVVVGESGILIRGVSGSGKSSLAFRLIEEARRDGVFGGLVGDDRVLLERRGGRIIARPHPSLAGVLEMRGLGLLRHPYDVAAVIRLVVDCDTRADRLPEPAEWWTDVLDIRLPRVAAGGHADPTMLVKARLHASESAFDDTLVTRS